MRKVTFIIINCTLVRLPVFVYLFEVLKVERMVFWQQKRLVVEDASAAVEAVLVPHALVGDSIVFVVQFSESVHFILFPVALIVSSFGVVESARSMSHAIQHEPSILSSIGILFLYVLSSVPLNTVFFSSRFLQERRFLRYDKSTQLLQLGAFHIDGVGGKVLDLRLLVWQIEGLLGR